uniref:Protein E6 n=1 Tax=Human papillomavirus TaxID=10566 RepID=A0A385PJC5_9PAPI|nr:MAG: E6 protein [Human papillomavirus]
MADLQPTNLEDYCNLHKISLFNLSLPCVFCKHNVNYVGLASFHYKQLSLIYKDNICHACCEPCLLLTAKYERERFCRCSAGVKFIETLCKKSLKDICVRCIVCYKLLDYIEKFDCTVCELPFYLIRHHWRNYCRHCVKHDWPKTNC